MQDLKAPAYLGSNSQQSAGYLWLDLIRILHTQEHLPASPKQETLVALEYLELLRDTWPRAVGSFTSYGEAGPKVVQTPAFGKPFPTLAPS